MLGSSPPAGTQGGSVTTQTGLRDGRQRFNSLQEPSCPDRLWGPRGNGGALTPGVKRAGREADYSPPSGAEVKKAWIYKATPRNIFMAWCFVKYRDNFTFA